MGDKIVVVDDHPASRDLLRDALEHAGYEVHTAGTAADGLALCRTTRCKVLISDIRLPGSMDGFQAVSVLRADPELRAVRAIALTAQAFPEDRTAALAAGFDEYLAKPVSLAKLREVVAQLLT